MLVSKDAIAKAVADMKGKSEKRKFNQSVELAVKLRELDLKRPEARIKESIELPTPPNKTTKVAVIAGGDLAVRAKNAGADLVIGKDDLDKLGRDKKQARKLAQNYDFFIAEAPLMPQVGKALGQMLGPRGKMPTPVPPNAPIDDVIKRQRRNARLMLKYPVIAAADLTKVRSSQIHELRKRLRDRVTMVVAKNNLLRKSVELGDFKEAKLGEFVKDLTGSNILLFSALNPYSLIILLDKSKVRVPAKAGDIATNEIMIPAGNTGLPPGPVISEFGEIRVRTRIEGGSIWIASDSVVARKGDTITAN